MHVKYKYRYIYSISKVHLNELCKQNIIILHITDPDQPTNLYNLIRVLNDNCVPNVQSLMMLC